MPYRGDILHEEASGTSVSAAKTDAPAVQLRDMKRRDIAARMALLAQISGSYFSYTVRESVSHGRYLRAGHTPLLRAGKEEDRAAIDAVLDACDLTSLADRPIDALSGGQLQRVFLARAFAQETPFLLLDEPANHLDLRFQQELKHYLLTWSKKETVLPDGSAHGNTLIGVFHDLPLALSLAEDILLLKEGRLLFCGTKETLLQKPKLLQEAFDIDVMQYLRSLVP